MVTHDQEEALTMADRIVVMNHGVIEQIGTPEQIYASPRSRFVAEFVGRANWLPGVAEAGHCVRVGDVSLQLADSAVMQPGQALQLFIRPEAISVTPRWQGGSNTVLAQLLSQELLGGFCRLTLSVPAMGNLNLIADVSRPALAQLKLDAGQRVPLTLAASALRVFVDGATA